MFGQHLGITKDDHAVFGACKGYVEAARIVQETNAARLVATHATEQDEVFLTTLETINGRNLDLLVELRVQLSLPLHVVHDERALTLVGCNNANLIRSEASIEERRHDLLDVLSLFAVQERSAASRYLLIAHRVEEVHGFVFLRPRELESFQDAVLTRYTILQRALIESHRRESTQTWVHTVLHLQSDGSDAEADETLEQRLIQACF